MRARDWEIAGGALFATLGVFTLYGSFRLGIGTPNQPGPGFFSSGIGALMTALSVISIVSGARLPKEKAAQSASFPAPFAIGVLLGAMLAYGLLLERAGFIACTFAFLLAMQAVGHRTLPGFRAIAMSAVMTGAIYLVFQILLKVGLPAGSWWA